MSRETGLRRTYLSQAYIVKIIKIIPNTKLTASIQDMNLSIDRIRCWKD